jgi:hypothetical protein
LVETQVPYGFLSLCGGTGSPRPPPLAPRVAPRVLNPAVAPNTRSWSHRREIVAAASSRNHRHRIVATSSPPHRRNIAIDQASPASNAVIVTAMSRERSRSAASRSRARQRRGRWIIEFKFGYLNDVDPYEVQRNSSVHNKT